VAAVAHPSVALKLAAAATAALAILGTALILLVGPP
jgi:hypothetical protein